MEQFWLSREEVRELDRRAIEGFGVPGIVLMENAGRGCAELLMRLNPEKKPVVILCGPGNNGGDGFVIARHLDDQGWQVIVIAIACPDPHHPDPTTVFDFRGLPPDAFANYQLLQNRERAKPFPDRGIIWPISLWGYAVHHPDTRNRLCDVVQLKHCWLVDALFGTGLNRALVSPFDEFVAMMNASRNPILAIDIPSGLDCDTGVPLGPTVRATHTATFVAHKKGFLNPESRQWTGEVHVIDIGAPRVLVDEYRQRHGERRGVSPT